MKGKFPKIIILIAMIFLAYKTLSQGIKSLSIRPKPAASEEQVSGELPPEELLLVEEQLSEEGTAKDKEGSADLLTALSDYGRVPFVTPSKETKAASNIEASASSRAEALKVPQLTTILKYEGKWFAILSGNLVAAGDKIGRTLVLDINEDTVKIEEAGRVYELKL